MNIVVIGGGAAGMSAASKARRMDKTARITVIEQTGYVSYAECGMPYYLSGYFKDSGELLHYPLSEFTEHRNLEVITGTKVEYINPGEKYVFAGNKKFPYDKLVIATGAEPRIPDEFKGYAYALRNMDDAIGIKEKIKGLNNVTIIGAGVLGTELFSLLSHKFKVKLISKHEYVLPHMDSDMGNILTSIVNESGNEIEYNSIPSAISGTPGNYQVTTGNGPFNTQIVIFATGIKPSTELAEKAGLELTADGLIKVNDFLQTSNSDIYAAGDNVATKNIVTGSYGYYPLAQIANKMGRTIGINMFGNSRVFPGALGTTIINVFGYQVGYTGINEATAKKTGIDYGSVYIKAKSKSNYLHGSDIFLKIIYNKKTEEIMGGQIIGKDNAAWRLNVIATAISGHMNLYDLLYNDLGYEPEYGPVWDPIIISASLALDKENKKV
ncbi:FAD-dependent oxidoreductase [Ferroplasma acidiphilum]|uniref:FAD-dependent oxidoreductase n=1 Tax=Ferroplasma acidiphilum TaxID=74969 RepID=UPI0028165050|nr:FAD-dependent oxidoreductase [Ferroplasma acidiphilum]WMT54036.1 MAG: FAD-dependent oxidoreductase [Ferroplasma acidiphilum]